MKKIFSFFFLITSVSICGFWPSFAEASAFMDEASMDLVYEQTSDSGDKEKKEDKRFSSIIGFQQINGFIVSADRINQLLFTGTYRFKKPWFVSLEQSLNHHYWRNSKSQNRGLLKDTILSIGRKFDFQKNRFIFGFSSTLPLSYHSQLNDVITASTAYLSWNLKLAPLFNFQSKWIKNPVLFVQPFYRYYVSLYKTSPTTGQSRGGTPLPEFSLGVKSLGLKVDITNYFSLNGSYGRWAVVPYKSKFKRDENSPYDRGYPWQYYSFFISGTVKIKKQWMVSLSYLHLDRLDRDGRLKTDVFNDLVSAWAFSVAYSFSFL